MKAFGTSVMFGILLWAVVFVSSIFIFPLKASNPPFFETLISIFLVLLTFAVAFFYFSKKEINIKTALAAGITWMIVNISIDLPMFSYGPMKKPFSDYMTDIGLTYLIIPIITVGTALISGKTKQIKQNDSNGKQK
jgi:hypothetical protein